MIFAWFDSENIDIYIDLLVWMLVQCALFVTNAVKIILDEIIKWMERIWNGTAMHNVANIKYNECS